jgi:hypothetical protein
MVSAPPPKSNAYLLPPLLSTFISSGILLFDGSSFHSPMKGLSAAHAMLVASPRARTPGKAVMRILASFCVSIRVMFAFLAKIQSHTSLDGRKLRMSGNCNEIVRFFFKDWNESLPPYYSPAVKPPIWATVRRRYL